MNDLIRKLARTLAEAFRRQLLEHKNDPESQLQVLREINLLVDSQDGVSPRLLLHHLLPEARQAEEMLEQNPLVRSVAINQRSELLQWAKKSPPPQDEALAMLERVSNPSPS